MKRISDITLFQRPPLRVQGLTAASQGFFIASRFLNDPGKTVIITADNAEAERLTGDLRFFLGSDGPVVYLPQWETLPYEMLSNSPEIPAGRLSALARLAEGGEDRFILVTTAQALLLKCTSPKSPVIRDFRLKVGEDTDRERLNDFLALTGYENAGQVKEPGSYVFRGGLLDCFPPNEVAPYRVEFFGDTVESIRTFDSETQRSLGNTGEMVIPPVREVHYYGMDVEGLLTRLADAAKGTEVGKLRWNIENRRFFPGMESYLPLFYADTATLLDFLPGDSAVIVVEPAKVAQHLDRHEREIAEGYEAAKNRGDWYPPPEALYAEKTLVAELVETSAGLALSEIADEPESAGCVTFMSREADRLHGVVSRFSYDCRTRAAAGLTVLFVGREEDTLKRVGSFLAEEEIGYSLLSPEGMEEMVRSLTARGGDPSGRILMMTGSISSGFTFEGARFAIVTEEEVFGRHAAPRREQRKRRAAFITDFSDVKPGDYVVHRDHGIGLYHGIRSVHAGEAADEYLEIEYAQDQRLFLPIASIHLLEKHSGGGGPRPVLDRMGGQTWAKTRARVKKGLLKMAGELLEIQALRQTGKAVVFSPEGNFHREFADSFGFSETPDQAQAIADVAADMEADRPMDRLVCGDVGYGKTEVAMRAAFKAAIDGKQVAVLAPTTLLVNQHFNNFRLRMEPFGVKVEMLSRFVPPKAQKEILLRAATGGVNILIGTHRLLQKDVTFADLGLLIIDEEQRFGVAHKERMKKLRATLDVVTLTATPIPRTLQMSLSGIREISVINTPPPERLSVTTFIRKFGNATIEEAINRELSRGGQVFFVHNSVRSIHKMLAWIKRTVPGVRAEVAHGQMTGVELEPVMDRFIGHKLDLLLCTSIIESGLDIPNANTIVVNRADRFGLAQLYQLRGRVGRGRHRAYAYMLVPPTLSPLAKKRIKAIEELSELGSGFKLAARDMEIRGAGNLLGDQQSGHITAVGFETYCRMLEEAVEELRTGAVQGRAEPGIVLDFVGKFEDSYLPELEQRMDFYYRIHRAESIGEIRQIEEELADRFGPLPEAAQKVVRAAQIRRAAASIGLERVESVAGTLSAVFPPAFGFTTEAAEAAGRTLKGCRIDASRGNALSVSISRIPSSARPTAVAEFLMRWEEAAIKRGLAVTTDQAGHVA